MPKTTIQKDVPVVLVHCLSFLRPHRLYTYGASPPSPSIFGLENVVAVQLVTDLSLLN